VWLEEWSTCACTDTMPRIHLRAHAIHTMVWPMLYIPWYGPCYTYHGMAQAIHTMDS
jgi:hypothetical protein